MIPFDRIIHISVYLMEDTHISDVLCIFPSREPGLLSEW